jgi:hypothetical protein
MATPIVSFPQATQPQFPPAQTTPVTPQGRSSAALILNFNAPITSNSNDGTPFSGNGAAGTGQSGDAFQRNANAPFVPNPNASPAQQLQDYFNYAQNARNQAEQARNDYLKFANQPFGQNPFQPQPNPLLQQQQAQQFQQQLQQLQQAQQMQQLQQMQQQQAQQQAQQLQQMQQMQQQPQQPPFDPNMQQQMQQPQQPPFDPNMQQQPQQPPGLQGAQIPELNAMIAQPQTPNDKLAALNEIAMRGYGDPATYELLKQEAMTPTPGLPPEEADTLRRTALLALGTTAQNHNASVPVGLLPGVKLIQQIIENPKESPSVKAAAVTALRLMDNPNRPTRPGKKEAQIDKTAIANLLKKAARDKNPDVKAAVTQPLPDLSGVMGGMGGGPMGMPPGGMPGMPPGGMPPGMMPPGMPGMR